MSAVLTLGTVAVATDGKTVTATISGGTGTGYAISSTATLNLHMTGTSTGQPAGVTGNNFGFYVATASVSGTTLTMTLGSSVGSGETVQLDIGTGSTLTDSGANTATGQTNIAVTNNSTVTIAVFDPVHNPTAFEMAVYATGGIALPLRGTTQVANIASQGLYPAEFVADATEIAFFTYSGASTQYAIDGATTTTTAPVPNSFWVIKPIASGLSAGKHLVALNYNDYFFGIRLTGSNRTLTSVAKTRRTIRPNTGQVVNAPTTTPMTLWGTWKDQDTTVGSINIGGTVGYESFTLDCQITGSGLQIITTLNVSSGWAVSVDGAAAGPLVSGGDANNNNNNGYVTLASGLSSATPHTIHAMMVSDVGSTTVTTARVINGTATTVANSAGDTTSTVASTTTLKANDWCTIGYWTGSERRQIASISGNVVTWTAALTNAHAIGTAITSYESAAGSIATWTRKDLSARRIVAMGDSNVEAANDIGFAGTPDATGTYYAFYDPRQSGLGQACDTLGYEMINLGIQGQTSTQMAARAADIAAFSRNAFDVLIIWAGTNDINGTATTPAQWFTNVKAMIDASTPYLRAGGKIILLPTPTPSGVTNAGGLNYAAEQTQITALVNAYPGVVVDGSAALSQLVAGDLNGVHYHASGQTKVGQGIVPFISGPAVFVNTGTAYPFSVAGFAKA